jgi:hypothetical protein
MKPNLSPSLSLSISFCLSLFLSLFLSLLSYRDGEPEKSRIPNGLQRRELDEGGDEEDDGENTKSKRSRGEGGRGNGPVLYCISWLRSLPFFKFKFPYVALVEKKG